jgi:hypothetical protein
VRVGFGGGGGLFCPGLSPARPAWPSWRPGLRPTFARLAGLRAGCGLAPLPPWCISLEIGRDKGTPEPPTAGGTVQASALAHCMSLYHRQAPHTPRLIPEAMPYPR